MATKTKAKANGVVIHDPSMNTTGDAARSARFEHEQPYSAVVTIEGVAHLICHKFDCDEVESKSKAAKGSKTKKTDNVESYVYRVPETNECGVPGKNIKAMLTSKKNGAAKSFSDPRSKMKSAAEMMQASIFVEPEVASLGKKTWDFIDRSHMNVQNRGIVRLRPGFTRGWRLTFVVNVVQPALVPPEFLRQVIDHAGNFCGLGDSRPDYGRFTVVSFEVKPHVSAR